MSSEYESFKIGVNIFVIKDEKLLLGKRKNVYGDGSWALPGGHLEHGEEIKHAGKRELFEETNLTAKSFS